MGYSITNRSPSSVGLYIAMHDVEPGANMQFFGPSNTVPGRVALAAGQTVQDPLAPFPYFLQVFLDQNYQWPGTVPLWSGFIDNNQFVTLYYDRTGVSVGSTVQPDLVTGGIYPRRSEYLLSDHEKQAYINAINTLNESGAYGELVAIHGQPHDMHGGGGEFGAERFLTWHRQYLLEFERLLRSVDPTIMLPYWNWSGESSSIPKWLADYQPLVKMPGNQAPIQVVRNPGTTPLPNESQVRAVWANDTFSDFTADLEDIHNFVHAWFANSTMNFIPQASADPIFWLHHANIDRIWMQWQYYHLGQNPTLPSTPTDNPPDVMDPWNVKEIALRDTRVLSEFPKRGYTYAWWLFPY